MVFVDMAGSVGLRRTEGRGREVGCRYRNDRGLEVD